MLLLLVSTLFRHIACPPQYNSVCTKYVHPKKDINEVEQIKRIKTKTKPIAHIYISSWLHGWRVDGRTDVKAYDQTNERTTYSITQQQRWMCAGGVENIVAAKLSYARQTHIETCCFPSDCYAACSFCIVPFTMYLVCRYICNQE